MQFAVDYHIKTKHSVNSIMNSQYKIDWNDRPISFKTYTNELPTKILPTHFSTPNMNAILSVNRIHPQNVESNENDKEISLDYSNNNNKIESKKLTLQDLSMILFFIGGITRIIKNNNNIYYMRAAPATGALYPIEIYIICKNFSSDLNTGIYHFNPIEFSLKKIREGDYIKEVSKATTDKSEIQNSSLLLIFTSIAWRNAWKYQDRSYRHWFWDAGVITANLLATNISSNIDSKIFLGFIDDKIDQILGLEKEKEATIAIVSFNTKQMPIINDKSNLESNPGINLTSMRTNPISKVEKSYPLIWKTHQSSKLFNGKEVFEWINAGLSQTTGFKDREFQPIQNGQILKRQNFPNECKISTFPSLGETILKRGSTRKFSRSPISSSILSNILFNSTRGIPMDFKKDIQTLVDIYLIINDVSGIDRGGYHYNQYEHSLNLINYKTSRDLSGHVCLDQPLFSDASVVLFLMSNLNKIIQTLGNRGYRAAQYEAGIIAGKIYLLSYAHSIGASGSTFYDDIVTDIFLPHSNDKNTMIAIGIGNPSYRSRAGKILPLLKNKKDIN
ncbi:MAG TPA: SagB/ThcOx family dehydrogenase [Candidatus Nitrosocosmicus sp.]